MMTKTDFVKILYPVRNTVSKSMLFYLLTCLVFMSIITGCAGSLSPIMNAARAGDISAIKRMHAEGQNINELDESGSTPLMHAIWKGKIDVAKQLIGSGADIRIKNKNGGDALIYAVEYNQVELVKILLDKGANIESKDSSETTPLIFSVFNGYYEIIEILLNRGANIEAKDWTGATAIVNAVKNSKSEKIVSLLIKSGADLNVKDKSGYTVLDWAFYNKNKELIAVITKGDDNIAVEEKISPLTQRYKELVFQGFTADSQITADYPTALPECENSAIAAVISKKLFNTVEKVKDGVKYNDALMVAGKVVNLKIVSLGSRIFGGVSAGASEMSVLLTFRNGTDGAVIKKTLLSSTSNSLGASITYGHSDRSLPDDMGKIIAEHIASITPAK